MPDSNYRSISRPALWQVGGINLRSVPSRPYVPPIIAGAKILDYLLPGDVGPKSVESV